MKFFGKNTLLLAGCIIAFSSFANTEFSLQEINSHGHEVFPNLDLNSATSARIHTSNNALSVHEVSIDKIEITFPNANDLVATNFKFNGSEYVSVVEDAWVFSKIFVRVIMPSTLNASDPVTVMLTVIDNDSKINTSSQINNNVVQLAEVHGSLLPINKKILADTLTIEHEGKDLTLSLYRDLVSEQGSSMFDVNISWLGHGSNDSRLPSPFPYFESSQFSAIALNFIEGGPDPIIEIKVKNANSDMIEIFSFPLTEFILSSGLE